MHRWGGESAHPSIITIFSAPNYCGSYHNKGAVLVLDSNKIGIKQYHEVDHPYHFEKNKDTNHEMDLFEWSFPLIAQKVSEMIKSINMKMLKIKLPKNEE